MYNKTVGVIGTGKIGKAFCLNMLGLGCKGLAYNVAPQNSINEKGVSYIEHKSVIP